MDGKFYDPEYAPHCPACESSTRIRTKAVPEHVRIYTTGDGSFDGQTEHTEHMPEARDRHCANCDHVWTDYPEGTRP